MSNNLGEEIGNVLTKLTGKYLFYSKLGIVKAYRSKLKDKKSRIIFFSWITIESFSITKIITSNNILEDITFLKYSLIFVAVLPVLNLIGHKKHKLQKALIKSNMYKKMGVNNYPEVVKVENKEGEKVTNISIMLNENSIELFQKRQEMLEEYLTNYYQHYVEIIEIKKSNYDRRFINIMFVNEKLPENYSWNIELLSKDKDKIFVGKSYFGDEYFSFKDKPHLIIAGEPGGGKGVMMKNILLQLLYLSKNENVNIAIADFKDGLDYVDFDKLIDVIESKKELNTFLDIMIKEMRRRNLLLKESKFENIHEYNKNNSNKLSRYYLFVDELTQCIDVDGLHKEADKKEIIISLEIKRKLTEIARLSRAAGIHLILTTQLPSTKVLGNQLKNNVPGRLCGAFSDDSASRIVLDGNFASRLPNIKGRMIFKMGGYIREIQTPYVSNYTVKKIIRTYKKFFKVNNNDTSKNVNLEKNKIEEQKPKGLDKLRAEYENKNKDQ